MIDFTVLMNVYNIPVPYLAEAVYSMLNQKVKQSFNILIVDDGTTDKTSLAFLEFLQARHANVKVLRMDKNSGTAAALNFGHKHITSKYVALMGGDDFSHADRLTLQLRYLEANPKTDVLGTNLFAFKNGDIRRKSIFTTGKKEIPDYQSGWLVNHGTVIYRNELVLKHGYNINFRRGQDTELWKRLFAAGHVFRNVTDVLYAYRRP